MSEELVNNTPEPSEASPEEILASLRGGDNAPSSEPPKAPEDPNAYLKQEYEYTVEGGKKVKEPLEMVMKRAGLGYHYAQRAQFLNDKETQIKAIEEQNKKLSRWAEFNDYAEKNPDWWKHVETSWQGRQNPVQNGQVDTPNPVIEDLKKQIEDLSAFKQQFVDKQQALEHGQQDREFRSEISNVSKQFNVDLDQSDEQGRTLTWRVLEHMKGLGLDGSKKGHFAAAFKDYYFDNLMGRTAEKTKEEHAKNQEQMRKAGILDVSRTPKAKGSLNGKAPSMSWDDLSKAALADKEIWGR